MNEQESVEAESAYGSETSLDSKSSIKKNALTTQKTSSRKRNRCKKQKYKLREHPILEAVFFLILVFLLITCYWIISQNQETHRMILSLQSQLNSVQKHIGKDFMSVKEEMEKENKNETEKTKEMSKGSFNEVRMPSITITTNKSKTEKTHVPPIIPIITPNTTLQQINAASLFAGAIIDESLSSSSSLSSWYLDFDQSELVLVDRPEPPANKAWCTSDKEPVLTVKLGYYIEPTAVSYQHSKWNGTIPDDAPKMYSVEVCLDSDCRKRKPLFSHCEYNSHGMQEQFCTKISNDSINSLVGKVQFRFHKNQGNTERTCVSLVRVYSTKEVVEEKKLRRLEDTTACLNLNHCYHHNPIKYEYFTFKNCSFLYSKGCCEECPECCEECEIKDVKPLVMLEVSFFVVIVPLIFILILCLVHEFEKNQ